MTEAVEKERLTTLMVTHSMQQAVALGDRLVMMHRGEIIADLSGSEKKSLRIEHLLERFEDVRRADQLDPSAATVLERLYV